MLNENKLNLPTTNWTDKTSLEDAIYDETYKYFDELDTPVGNMERLPLIHFRLENKGLTLREAITVLENRKLVDTLKENKENK